MPTEDDAHRLARFDKSSFPLYKTAPLKLPFGNIVLLDRSAIFSDVLKRNALRREVGLSLLRVRDVYRQEVLQAEWRAFAAQHGSETRASVLRQQRKRYGQSYPQSTGGRWAVDILVGGALREQFRATRRTQLSKTF